MHGLDWMQSTHLVLLLYLLAQFDNDGISPGNIWQSKHTRGQGQRIEKLNPQALAPQFSQLSYDTQQRWHCFRNISRFGAIIWDAVLLYKYLEGHYPKALTGTFLKRYSHTMVMDILFVYMCSYSGTNWKIHAASQKGLWSASSNASFSFPFLK